MSDTECIWRVEWPEGKGVYAGDWKLGGDGLERYYRCLAEGSYDSEHHPSISNDLKLDAAFRRRFLNCDPDEHWPIGWRFGFASEQALGEWFSGKIALSKLQASDCADGRLCVVRYEVPAAFVLCGSKQAMFEINHARRIVVAPPNLRL